MSSFSIAVALSLMPALGLWMADGGKFGQSTLARIVFDCLILLISLPVVKPLFRIPSKTSLFSLVTAFGLGLAGVLFFHPVCSGISGHPFSTAEKLEVLMIGPLSEEFYFRGLMWKVFERTFSSKRSVRILIGTSFAFGFYHIGFWSHGLTTLALPHIAGAFVAGLVFGYIRLKSKGLAWPTVAHGLANSLVLLSRVL